MKIARYEKKPSFKARLGKALGRIFLALCLLAGVLGLWLYLTPAPEGFPILEYHMVNDQPDEDGYDYAVPVEEFKAHSVDELMSMRIRPSFLNEYLRLDEVFKNESLLVKKDGGYAVRASQKGRALPMKDI